MNKKTNKRKIAVVMMLGLLPMLYQNCAPSGFHASPELDFSSAESSISDDDGGSAGAGPEATHWTDRGIVLSRSENCFTDPKVNACLVWKNPIAAKGARLIPAYSQSRDLRELQVHGVSVSGYDASGFLKNGTFQVVAGGRGIGLSGGTLMWVNTVPALATVDTTSGSFKFQNDGDPDLRLAQVSAFYWAQEQLRFMKERVGHYYIENQGVRLHINNPDYENGIFDYNQRAVALGNKNNKSFALYGDLMAHELGHGNVFFASGGRISQVQGTPDADRECNPAVTGTISCCPTRNGCAKAINEGLADYHAAIMFPALPRFSETWADSVDGLKTPSGELYRDPFRNRALTVVTAFNVVATLNGVRRDLPGEARSMAVLYTSIWWEMRATAELRRLGGGRDIDRIFSEHLVTLTGADHFLTARDKILAVDAALFGGRYADIIRGEFVRRGY